MHKRKLSALNYPQANNLNPNNPAEFRHAIDWLEANKIRKYKPNDVNPLKNVDSNQWDAEFQKYKDQFGCPIQNDEPAAVLDWLVNYAVKLEYGSKKNVYERHAVENIKKQSTPNVVAENPLDQLDYTNTAFTEAVRSLAGLVQVSAHPNPFVTLKAVTKIVCERLSPYAIEHPEEVIVQGKPFPFESVGGFNLGEAALNKAADVMRLLYIHDLRELQTRANELIVAVQNVTANPKTDTKLGKVGV